MNMLEIINKKKLCQELTREELVFFANGIGSGTVRDYHAAALLMAIRLNGMNYRETVDLTMAMRDSGDIVDLSAIPGIKVDKHSTGGVGDTTSLVLTPLVAACGVPVAKMSGRGLGHTGGTLDKMESIPGMSVSVSEADFIRQVQRIGLAVIGQTANLAPADKAMYSLRDVTGTVDSLPLIVSSIMSKKLASGADAIVLDVKYGSGAIMQTAEEARVLAKTMREVGALAGKPVYAIISSMEQPLGTHVGNALEVKEAIDILSGRAAGDLLQVSLTLGSLMVCAAGKAAAMDEARSMLEEALRSGAGLEKLRQMIRAQGGDPRVCDDVTLLPQAQVIRMVKAGCCGYVSKMDTAALGNAAQRMGAGRLSKEDVIDFSVGFVMHARLGDLMAEETPFFTLYAGSEADADAAEAAIRAAVTVSAEQPVLPALIEEIMAEF